MKKNLVIVMALLTCFIIYVCADEINKSIKETSQNDMMTSVDKESNKTNNSKIATDKGSFKSSKKKNTKEKTKSKNKVQKNSSGTNKFSDNTLINSAASYYATINGINNVGAKIDGSSGDDITIQIYQDNGTTIGTLDWYTVNMYTGKGTDFLGDPIDIMNPPTTTANNYSNDEYIFPYSNSQYLTDSDLWSMSSEELRIARNEIYARHGRMFKDQALQNYFNSKSWYTPSVRPEDFNEHWLNEYEKANAQLIKSFE